MRYRRCRMEGDCKLILWRNTSLWSHPERMTGLSYRLLTRDAVFLWKTLIKYSIPSLLPSLEERAWGFQPVMRSYNNMAAIWRSTAGTTKAPKLMYDFRWPAENGEWYRLRSGYAKYT